MLRLSRRQLLKTTAISTALAATPQSVLAASREKLTIPPLMEAKRGRPIILKDVYKRQANFKPNNV